MCAIQSTLSFNAISIAISALSLVWNLLRKLVKHFAARAAEHDSLLDVDVSLPPSLQLTHHVHVDCVDEGLSGRSPGGGKRGANLAAAGMVRVSSVANVSGQARRESIVAKSW